MATWQEQNFEMKWLHEDGNFYSAFKLPYEGKSALFLVYNNGFSIPADFVMGK
jgi:hypothetical protein